MRVLVFGSSGELAGSGEAGGTTLDRLCAGLEQHTGQPVEGQFAFSYPNPGLRRHVEKTLDRVDPDVVVVHCRAAPVRDLSLQLGLERRFGGRLPGWLAFGRDAARRLTDYDIVSGVDRQHSRRSALYGALRDALLLAGLGATPATVEETVAIYDEVFRTVVARECLLAVCGPASTLAVIPNRRLQARKMARLTALDRGLAAVCAARRVPYASVLATVAEDPEAFLGPDRAHRSLEGASLRAETDLRLLLPLLPQSRAAPAPGSPRR